MTQHPFNNDSTPAEREAGMKNDQRVATRSISIQTT
jgi:hypothetical protein